MCYLLITPLLNVWYAREAERKNKAGDVCSMKRLRAVVRHVNSHVSQMIPEYIKRLDGSEIF